MVLQSLLLKIIKSNAPSFTLASSDVLITNCVVVREIKVALIGAFELPDEYPTPVSITPTVLAV